MELIVLYVAFATLAGWYASKKGLGFGFTFIISLILSPLIGFLIALLRSPKTQAVEAHAIASGDSKKCPDCAELVRAEAAKCRYCGHHFTTA